MLFVSLIFYSMMDFLRERFTFSPRIPFQNFRMKLHAQIRAKRSIRKQNKRSRKYLSRKKECLRTKCCVFFIESFVGL